MISRIGYFLSSLANHLGWQAAYRPIKSSDRSTRRDAGLRPLQPLFLKLSCGKETGQAHDLPPPLSIKSADCGSAHRTCPHFAPFFFAAFFPARASSANCILCAFTIVEISPGYRSSTSAHRELLCISTPCRSPRTNPASRKVLKCCDSVDFGIGFWSNDTKL